MGGGARAAAVFRRSVAPLGRNAACLSRTRARREPRRDPPIVPVCAATRHPATNPLTGLGRIAYDARMSQTADLRARAKAFYNALDLNVPISFGQDDLFKDGRGEEFYVEAIHGDADHDPVQELATQIDFA
jgi:hypothetical protein